MRADLQYSCPERREACNQGIDPQGWAIKGNDFLLSELSLASAYEIICAANGGYGERVEKPEEVLPALLRALRVVREEGRQAGLNVICRLL